MFGMEAAVLPLLTTTSQLDPRVLPLMRDSEFWEERRHSLREVWISFTSHRGGRPWLGETKKGQETLSFADLNPPQLPWRAGNWRRINDERVKSGQKSRSAPGGFNRCYTGWQKWVRNRRRGRCNSKLIETQLLNYETINFARHLREFD